MLHFLLSMESSTRAELSRLTGLSVATVATIVTELLAENLVVEAGLEPGVAGRPTTVLRINGQRGDIVGIDVAETYVRAVVFDAALIERAAVEISLDESLLSVDYVASAIVRAIDEAMTHASGVAPGVLGAGIALPGLIHGSAEHDVVEPNRAWHNAELVERLRQLTSVPLVVDNPLKAIATAELWFGRGRTAASMVIANLGTGVGAGIVIEGKILRGATNSAGEWGHSLLVLDGRMCRCGKRGCVEAYVGAPGIQQTLREVAPTHVLTRAHQRDFIDAVAQALEAGDQDPALTETLNRTARFLGYALADVAAVINPELLMLTGWTTWRIGELLLPLTRNFLEERAPVGSVKNLELGVSTVRGNSVSIGMATLAFERFLGDVGLPTT